MSIPEPEPFLDDQNEFNSRFMPKAMSTWNDSNEIKSVSSTGLKVSRAGRWLKTQDRELILTFYQLARIHTNTKSHEFWVKMQDELKTERPVKFLRRRYRKLVRTQTLNKHEKLFFKENHAKFNPKQFMIIFPGKSRQTIDQLYKNLKSEILVNNQISQMVTQRLSNVSQFFVSCHS